MEIHKCTLDTRIWSGLEAGGVEAYEIISICDMILAYEIKGTLIHKNYKGKTRKGLSCNAKCSVIFRKNLVHSLALK